MSISNEIERITDAKQSLRDIITSRGIQIDENTLISEYPDLADALPFVVKGTFTPEADTGVFDMRGLDFSPEGVLIGCVELGSAPVLTGIYAMFLFKNQYGFISFCKVEGQSHSVVIKPGSTALSWSDSGVQMEIATGVNARFKKGYTYNYIILGGKA